MPSTTLKTNLGAILIGTLVNLSLYTLEVTQVIAYFASPRRKTDRLWVQLNVLLNLFLDTIASFASWAGIFIYSVLNWGHFEDLQHNIWPLVMVILVDGLVTFSVQSFMVYRYWKMSANHVITTLIILCMLTTLGGTLRTGISSVLEPSLAERRDHLQTSILSFGGNCITDVSLTCALLYELHLSVRGSFTRNTRGMLWRVTFMVITTGCVPSLFTTTGVVLLAVEPKTYLATAVAFMYGRVYSLTMLYTLNLREKIRGDTLVNTVDVVSSRFEARGYRDTAGTASSRTRGGSDASDAAFARKNDIQSRESAVTEDTFAEFLRADSVISSDSSSDYDSASSNSSYDWASEMETGLRGMNVDMTRSAPSMREVSGHVVVPRECGGWRVMYFDVEGRRKGIRKSMTL